MKAIEAAVEAADADLVDFDSATNGRDFVQTLRGRLEASDLVLAYSDEREPYVAYEVGFAQALRKPLIALTRVAGAATADLPLARQFIFDDPRASDMVSRLTTTLLDALQHLESLVAEVVAENSKQRTKLFISYSHCDADYLSRLLVHLRPLERANLLDAWADTRINPGADWQHEIEEALQAANVAVLLVSADFLASDFVVTRELPRLLRRAEQDGTRILPLILKPCRFSRDESLRGFQSINDPARPLATLPNVEQEGLYDRLAAEIERWLPQGA